MKRFNIIFKFLTLIFILSGCEDKYTEQYLSLEPVYMSYKDFREAVKVESTHSLLKPGKIYYKDNYLFINEIMKGIHVYNNTNPCLLYTSDAADEEDSVDLGGRRIIKK